MEIDPKTLKLSLTDAAFQQILLIQRHDYTLKGLSFRVKIGGKGCNGFTYETGFSPALPDDLMIKHSAVSVETGQTEEITIHMDPFTGFYTQVASLDFQIDALTHEEGFILTNHHESLYKGKFYKDTTMVPPWEKRTT